MEKIIKLTETDLNRIIKKVLKEQEVTDYMFFSNIKQIKRQCEILLEMDPQQIDEIINEGGHDWADDHITEAKNNMDQVFDFLMNETEKEYIDYEDITEGKKKKNVATNKKLWNQCLSWARERYDICPSAYCNGSAVKRYNSKGGKWKKE
jgi:hypothetical protein